SHALRLHLIIPRPPPPTLFPYTTLFRSSGPRSGPRHARSLPRPRVAPVSVSAGDGRSPARPGCSDDSPPAARPHHRRKARPSRRSEEHTSELQSRENLVCRLLLEKKKDI